MRKYTYFDHITRGQVTDGLHNGTIPQDEHDAFFFLVNAFRGGVVEHTTREAVAIVRDYLQELKESGVPRLASHEDTILSALLRWESYDMERAERMESDT